ncbi:GDSL esterase/lipase [Glycine soja]
MEDITLACGLLGNVVSNANILPYECDSISDTRNAAIYHPVMPSSTYFKHPSGRMSNGRLIIDFIVEAYGMPIALNKNSFEEKRIKLDEAAYSLSTQLDWFKKLMPSLCNSIKECNNYIKNSLFLVGEIGGNDINTIIPYKNITALGELELIEEGAVNLVIPGNFPIGCLMAYNAFIKYYNEQLKKAIKILRQENTNAKITYFDYYGFSSDKIETFRACCGKDEPYNLSLQIYCGSPAATVCPDLSKHIN